MILYCVSILLYHISQWYIRLLSSPICQISMRAVNIKPPWMRELLPKFHLYVNGVKLRGRTNNTIKLYDTIGDPITINHCNYTGLPVMRKNCTRMNCTRLPKMLVCAISSSTARVRYQVCVINMLLVSTYRINYINHRMPCSPINN